MNDNDLPYYFAEAFEARPHSSARELARGFDDDLRTWLHTVRISTALERLNQQRPMQVEKIILNFSGQPAIELAGAFLMTALLQPYTVLYTPEFGLESFTNRAGLEQRLTERLDAPVLRDELMALVDRTQRKAVSEWDAPQISYATIEGDVFMEVAATVEANQRRNLQVLQAELLKLPSLPVLLDQVLQVELTSLALGWNRSTTRLITYRAETTVDSAGQTVTRNRQVASQTLEEAVLSYFRHQHWPAGQTYQVSDHGTGETPYHASSMENQQWLDIISTLGTNLPNRLQAQLERYWSTVLEPGLTRMDVFARILKDGYQAGLLKGLASARISPQDYQWLKPLNEGLSLQAEALRLSSEHKPFMELSGYLMLSNPRRPGSPFFLYQPCASIRAFGSAASLHSHLLSPLNTASVPEPLINALALKERQIVVAYHSPGILSIPVPGPMMLSVMQTIADKQAHNLNHVMNLYRTLPQVFDLAAVIDSVLDVRHLIDPALLTFDTQGRWSTHLNLQSLQAPPPRPDMPTPLSPEEALEQQIPLLEGLRHSCQHEMHICPALYAVAQSALNDALRDARLTSLNAGEIVLNQYSSPPSSNESRPPLLSQDLVDHFIERFNGFAAPLSAPEHWGAYSRRVEGISQMIPELGWRALNALIDTALTGFSTFFFHQHRDFYTRLMPFLSNTQQAALRNELIIKARSHPEIQRKQDVLLRVLDNPVQALRKGLNGFIPQVFGMSVVLPGKPLPLDLQHAFLITEHGGLDPRHSGCVLFWTPVAGLEFADSLNLALNGLNSRLATPNLHEMFQGLQSYPDRLTPWQHDSGGSDIPPRIQLRLIEANFIETFNHAQIASLTREIHHAVAQPLPAHQTQDWIKYSQTHQRFNLLLEHTLNLARNAQLLLSAPHWLATAPEQHLLTLAGWVEQHHQQTRQNLDFLNGNLPDLEAFTHVRLVAQIEADHPGHGLDLGHFSVVAHPLHEPPGTLPVAQQHSLIELMLSHGSHLDDHQLTLASTDAGAVPDWMTIDYLKQLHRRLDIGRNFQTIMRPRFEPHRAGDEERCRMFSQHAPWQLLAQAMSLHLQGQLSSTALNLVEQLMEMPDHLARTPVNGHKAVLREVHLRHMPNATPTRLEGLHWIQREHAHQGPWVLLTLFNDVFHLNEYAHGEAFLSTLRHSNSLQSLVLERLPGPVRTLYSVGHFLNAQLGSSMGGPLYTGNVLKKLYHDTCHVVLNLLGQQHSSFGQTAWHIAKSMFCAAERLGTFLLLGKQRLPLIAWQLLPQLLKAAKLAWQGEWKHSMSECAQILLQLALAKISTVVPATPAAPVPAALTQAGSGTTLHEEASPETLSVWHNRIQLTPSQEHRLRSYEIKHLELSSLNHDASTGLYTDPLTQKHYVPVTGKIFQVEQVGLRWRIVGVYERGPFLLRDEQQQWQLDLKGYLLGGGAALGKIIDQAEAQALIQIAFNVEAIGMKKINRLYPHKAAIIRNAHERALHYLAKSQISLRQSQPDVFAHPRNREFLKSIFGENNITEALRQRLLTSIATLRTDMLSEAMSPLDSDRYVVGTLRGAHENSYGFVHPNEKPMRIYLTELYFKPPLDKLAQCTREPFEVLANAQILTLIHEQTHISLNTLNIAYVDAILPLYDLIDTNTEQGRNVYEVLYSGQTRGLSTLTPLQNLFKLWDHASDLWIDPEPSTVAGIIRLAESRTLSAARYLFTNNDSTRLKIILNNADSLTLVVAILNRTLEVVPATPLVPAAIPEILLGFNQP